MGCAASVATQPIGVPLIELDATAAKGIEATTEAKSLTDSTEASDNLEHSFPTPEESLEPYGSFFDAQVEHEDEHEDKLVCRRLSSKSFTPKIDRPEAIECIIRVHRERCHSDDHADLVTRKSKGSTEVAKQPQRIQSICGLTPHEKRKRERNVSSFPLYDLPNLLVRNEPVDCKPVLETDEPEGAKVLTIFDWDDTLCPTTWLTEMEDDSDSETPVELPKTFVNAAQNIMEVARKFGDVAVVTLAERSWLERGLAQYPPDFVGCPVYHARDYAQCADLQPCASRINDEGQAASLSAMVSLKYRAMAAVVGDRDYTHVISIGDGKFEALAVHDLFLHGSVSYTKSVKFAEDPTLDELILQLDRVADTLPAVVAAQRRMHLDTSNMSDFDTKGVCGLLNLAPAA
jgi:hypothetical protein